MNITNYAPVVVRYLLVTLAAAMFTHGWLTPEQSSALGQNMDLLVSAVVGLGTVAYALIKRPSQKALDAAKEIDKKIPASQPVEIVTPGSAPNIIVRAGHVK